MCRVDCLLTAETIKYTDWDFSLLMIGAGNMNSASRIYWVTRDLFEVEYNTFTLRNLPYMLQINICLCVREPGKHIALLNKHKQ